MSHNNFYATLFDINIMEAVNANKQTKNKIIIIPICYILIRPVQLYSILYWREAVFAKTIFWVKIFR